MRPASRTLIWKQLKPATAAPVQLYITRPFTSIKQNLQCFQRHLDSGDHLLSRARPPDRAAYSSWRQYHTSSSRNAEGGNKLNDDASAAPDDGGGPKKDTQRPAHSQLSSLEERLERLRQEGVARATEDAKDKHDPVPPPQSTGPVEPPSTPVEPVANPAASAIPSSSRIDHERASSLPSESVSSRSDLSRRLHQHMETLLTRLAVASQQLNIYTGTDYSGINALREKIVALEKEVRSRHETVDTAKESHSIALAAQSTSQKEVVQLLERKHSWSAGDLERYMTLIRSEHLNEQAVQSAKDAVAQAERGLEEVRAKLEKYERRQYHEEQVWSDTIRRNSTWVTFGLMGFNIFLLLASLVLIEPWRRRRLVREVRAALDEKSTLPAAAASTAVAHVEPASKASSIEGVDADNALPKTASPTATEAVDAATPPMSESLENLQESTAAAAHDAPTLQGVADNYLGVETTTLPSTPDVPIAFPPGEQAPMPPPAFTFYADNWTHTFELWKAYWADLFSERMLSVKKKDLTTAAVEGAVAGAACMGLLFVLLRPR